MKKKFLAILLSATMVLSMAVPSFASDEIVDEAEEILVIEEDEAPVDVAEEVTPSEPGEQAEAEPSFEGTIQDGMLHLEARDLPEDETARFSIWTEAGEQDDLITVDGVYNEESGIFEADADLSELKHYGQAWIMAERVDAEEQSIQIGELQEFSISKPTAVMKQSISRTKGTFTVALVNVDSLFGVKKIVVSVWTKADKSDMKKYVAEKAASGNYKIKGSMADFKNAVGAYQVHANLVDLKGYANVIGSDTLDFAVRKGTTSISEISAEKTYRAITKNLEVPGGIKQVFYKVWNNEEGKSIYKKYTAEYTTKGNYTAKINVKDFAKVKSENAFSAYTVCAYAQTKAGTNILISKNTNAFAVETRPTATVKYGSFNAATGKVKIRVSVQNAPSGVSSVQVPVWYKTNQSDLKWYTTKKDTDGTYVTYIPVAEHNYHSGTYKVHAYVKMGNGIQVKAAGVNVPIKFENYLHVDKHQNFVRQMCLENPSANLTDVKVAVWSEKGGQDDTKWITMSKSGNAWVCSWALKDFKHNGTFNAHVYSGKTCIQKTTFQVAENYTKAQWQGIEVLNRVGWNLRAAYNYSAGLTYLRVPAPPAGTSHVEYYAEIGFANGFGHCYIMASTFIVMARLLGYEAYLVEGDVAAAHGGRNPHGWCEIVEDGRVWVYDPNCTNETGRDAFKVYYGKPGTWQYGNYGRVD